MATSGRTGWDPGGPSRLPVDPPRRCGDRTEPAGRSPGAGRTTGTPFDTGGGRTRNAERIGMERHRLTESL
jgi:hypothetical protein